MAVSPRLRLHPRYDRYTFNLLLSFFSSPLSHSTIPPAMFKLFVLCFSILTLICAIQCTPTAVRRDKISPLPKRDYPSPLPKRDYPSPLPKRDYPSPLPKRDYPSSIPKRDAIEIRGLCDFLCPQENLVGTGLSRMSTDSGRLYCRYDVEEMGDNGFCMYNRVRSSWPRSDPFATLISNSDLLEHRRTHIQLFSF